MTLEEILNDRFIEPFMEEYGENRKMAEKALSRAIDQDEVYDRIWKYMEEYVS